ncbi:MAG: polysaccharide deacetylase family protein, partial [Acidobacteria bacterium]|nr:polysaccharide deacetylase family protein [Acidobacteriota bacterium]
EGEAEGRAILREWLNHGHALGNHTASHADFNDLTLEQFQDEVIRGEASLEKPPRHFRFPYNHTGATMEKHEAAAQFLARRGYLMAPCTIDTSDYLFALPYDLMLARHDQESASRLRAAYLAHTKAEIDYFGRLNRRVMGRVIPDVLLLHANPLNAAFLDEILGIFEKKNYRFVTLDQALSDKAYHQPDTYLSDHGPMWGYRWAAQRHKKRNGQQEPRPSQWILDFK